MVPNELSRVLKLLFTYRAITSYLLICLLPKRELLTLFLQMSASKKACIWIEVIFDLFQLLVTELLYRNSSPLCFLSIVRLIEP